MKPCCTPSQRDDDRTHTIRYWQAYFDGEPGDPPVMEELGTYESRGILGLACSHNDAIDTARLIAADWERRHGIAMAETRTPGKWRAHDYQQGEGTKFEVWIYRGPAEEDYDAARTVA